MARAARQRYPGETGIREPAYEVVFMAMAHHQLGHRDAARAALDGLGTASTDKDLQQLSKEATALIHEPSAPRSGPQGSGTR
jgi:hypothetical protein